MEQRQLRLVPGSKFSVCTGDPDDLEPVTIRQVTDTHVLLESNSDLGGWRPRSLVEGVIAEANAQRSLRTLL